ncbi:MAG: hypothetical protein ACI9UR_002404 [Bacteroidia bacterium]|jgi:hypothetical protein
MRRIFGVLMILAVSTTAFGFGPASETGVEIYPTVVSSELNIDVDDKLINGKVTISVFNSFGEIMIEENLGLGLNKLDTSKLDKGSYVAVVRQNGEYKNKQAFEVV